MVRKARETLQMRIQQPDLGMSVPAVGPLPGQMVFGIGGQRCGSSWLHTQLARHPDIRMPGTLKEVHFFDTQYHRGVSWYAGLFAGGDGALWCDATPYYLYAAEARERIAAQVADPRFIVLLRDPRGRSLSHYRRYLANSGRALSFSRAVADRPSILGFSRYSGYLRGYLERFGRARVHVALYEDILRQPERLISDVMGFLDLAPIPIGRDLLAARVNAAPQPRHPVLHAAAESGKRWLLSYGLSGVVAASRSLGLRDVVTRRGPPEVVPELTVEENALLDAVRNEEAEALERLGICTKAWGI
jgi:hypothetical protein